MLVYRHVETDTIVAMCGRFTLRAPDRIKFALAHSHYDELVVPRFNIAPGQHVLAILDGGNSPADLLLWGLIPSWSSDSKGFINARAETLQDRPSFSDAFLHRRCLIPADGFYEWKRTGRARQAFYFQLRDEVPFAFAGVWDTWKTGQQAIASCAIITTKANELLNPIHDRMPVIVKPEKYDLWLDRQTSVTELQKLLCPFPAEEMNSYPVSSGVNRAGAEGSHLIKRVDLEIGTTPSLF
ncbi:MAG: SOS response-associated peptidase [Pyrinomonadaceae bacterium]